MQPWLGEALTTARVGSFYISELVSNSPHKWTCVYCIIISVMHQGSCLLFTLSFFSNQQVWLLESNKEY